MLPSIQSSRRSLFQGDFALLLCLLPSSMKFTTAATALCLCSLASAKTWVLSERLAVSLASPSMNGRALILILLLAATCRVQTCYRHSTLRLALVSDPARPWEPWAVSAEPLSFSPFARSFGSSLRFPSCRNRQRWNRRLWISPNLSTKGRLAFSPHFLLLGAAVGSEGSARGRRRVHCSL